MIGGGQAAMAVAIEGDPEKSYYFLFGWATFRFHGEIAPRQVVRARTESLSRAESILIEGRVANHCSFNS